MFVQDCFKPCIKGFVLKCIRCLSIYVPEFCINIFVRTPSPTEHKGFLEMRSCCDINIIENTLLCRNLNTSLLGDCVAQPYTVEVILSIIFSKYPFRKVRIYMIEREKHEVRLSDETEESTNADDFISN